MSAKRYVCVCIIYEHEWSGMRHMWLMSWRELICICPDGWPESFDVCDKFSVEINPALMGARIAWTSKTKSLCEVFPRRRWLILPHD